MSEVALCSIFDRKRPAIVCNVQSARDLSLQGYLAHKSHRVKPVRHKAPSVSDCVEGECTGVQCFLEIKVA